MKEKPMKKGLVKAKTLTRDQAAELRELEALPDDQIDTGDIPEIADWSEARRGGVSSTGQATDYLAVGR